MFCLQLRITGGRQPLIQYVFGLLTSVWPQHVVVLAALFQTSA
jgi:hypothetical protein